MSAQPTERGAGLSPPKAVTERFPRPQAPRPLARPLGSPERGRLALRGEMSAQPTERGAELSPPQAVTERFPRRSGKVNETPDGELRRRQPPERARDALCASGLQKPLAPLEHKGRL